MGCFLNMIVQTKFKIFNEVAPGNLLSFTTAAQFLSHVDGLVV
jgi:hypothetical protein